MKKITASVLFFILLSLTNAGLQAQPFWTQVPLPNIYNYINPYFLNSNVGFVFDGYGSIQPNLRRTTDGGSTWTALQFFDDLRISLQQLYFISLTKGYAATEDGVYETDDAGNSWKRIYNDHISFNSVYAFGNKVFAFACFPPFGDFWGPLIETSDGGKTWDTVITTTTYTSAVDNRMRPYVCGNGDSIVYAENIDPLTNNMSLVYSSNNGKNWSTVKMDIPNKTFTMGLLSIPHCTDLIRTFIAPSDVGGFDVYLIVHTSDFGKHWDTLYFHVEIGAWVAGNRCAMYVSNATPFSPNKGLYRSTDLGKSWPLIPNLDFTEIDDRDFHNISVVGGGAVVYATPFHRLQSNILWKTTTGGDGTLSAAQFASQITFDHTIPSGNGDTLIMKECDSGLVKMTFENISCNFTHLDGITIEGLDSSEYSSQLIHHLFCDGLPDTLLINIIKPGTVGIRNLTVHSRFINDEYETIDTSFGFTLVTSSASGSKIYLHDTLASTAASDTLELPLYLYNSSPLPLQLGLDSIDLTYKLNTDLLTPFVFIPSESDMIASRIVITPTSASFTLYFPSGYNFRGETELGKLRCKVYVTDSLESDIALSGNPNTSPCQSILSNSSIHFTLANRCGDSALSNFMKFGSAISITSIIPNPARNSISVHLKNNEGELRYELFDGLGNSRKNGIVTGNSFQINIYEFSAGIYYLRLIGERGLPITKKILVAK